ncbi:unnamed protein product, partial [Urochloa humidicola]
EIELHLVATEVQTGHRQDQDGDMLAVSFFSSFLDGAQIIYVLIAA